MSNLKVGHGMATIRFLRVEEFTPKDGNRTWLKLKGAVDVTSIKPKNEKAWTKIAPEKVWVDIFLSTFVTNMDEAIKSRWLPKDVDQNDPQTIAWLNWAKSQTGGILTKGAYEICELLGIDLDQTPDWTEIIGTITEFPEVNIWLKYQKAFGKYPESHVCASIQKTLGRKQETPEQEQDRIGLTKKLMANMKRMPKLDGVGIKPKEVEEIPF